MGKVERLEREIEELSPEERGQFRAWFLDFDWAGWDAQLERDAQEGRLDPFAERALAEHAAKKTTRL